MKAEKPRSSTKPSLRLISLPQRWTDFISSKQRMNNNIEAPTAKGISFFTVDGLTTIGATSAAQPTISIVLKILEPMTLPTAKSGVPLRAETRLTNSSGAEVPAATMVRPMTISDMFTLRATAEAPSTRRSAPHSTRTTPAIINNPFSIIYHLYLKMHP